MSFCIIFVCFVMYFIVHAAFVHTKLMMMMMITMMITLSFNPLFRRAKESSAVCIKYSLWLIIAARSVKCICKPYEITTSLKNSVEQFENLT